MTPVVTPGRTSTPSKEVGVADGNATRTSANARLTTRAIARRAHAHARTIRGCSTISTTWRSSTRLARSACGCSWSPRSCSSAACSWPTCRLPDRTSPAGRSCEASHHLDISSARQHGRADRQLADDGAGGARRADRARSEDAVSLARADDAARLGVPGRQGDRVRRRSSSITWCPARTSIGNGRAARRRPRCSSRSTSHDRPARAAHGHRASGILTWLLVRALRGRLHGPSTTRRSRSPACTGTSSTSSGSSCSRSCI